MLIIDCIVSWNWLAKEKKVVKVEKTEEKKIEVELKMEDAVELLFDLMRSRNPSKLRVAKEIVTEILYESGLSYEKYSIIRLEIEKRLVTAEALEEEIFRR